MPKVVDQLQQGWQFLEQAITVWRLVEKERADEIEAIKNRASLAAGDSEIRLYADELQKLVRLLTGVDDAIVAAGIVDRESRVPADHWKSWRSRCRRWISRRAFSEKQDQRTR